jgi:nickel superoxide dismutase
MSEGHRFLAWVHRQVDRIAPPPAARAHCDIPCGIYDPQEAQVAALTVLRMDQLMAELPRPTPEMKPEESLKYHSQFARFVEVKEKHADKCEDELVTLQNDYFSSDHRKKWPDLDERFYKAALAISKARVGTAVAEAEEALKQVQAIAEIFWESKGAKSARVPTHSKAGGEFVVPIS